ncbi:hypothetical protein ACIQRS_25835 [Streptomyces termitum]|uniref:Uncharacterized protein n=1 Tax=Streptomyces termitum TaxID=67368 RepID=A0A918WDP9_9ACTN|nr:hypothetical protein [Streptomyces termitum]GHB08705.1 hypothetical protein GCM10010305_59650 [Streptomyces termitum]
MAKRDKKATRRKPDTTCFVQVAREPSIGVEVSTGRPWVGVDQQVGHGSADALFALTREQYATALADAWEIRPFMAACWRGEHDDLRLFDPRGGAWIPGRWFPSRPRVIPPRFAGELWHHADALADTPDGERTALSRALAAGPAHARPGPGSGPGPDGAHEPDSVPAPGGEHGPDAVPGPDGGHTLTFALTGDGAYPRPAALIAGLDAGSDRERARAVLGDPLEGAPDTYPMEGDRVRLHHTDGGLTRITLERPAPAPLPSGPIRAFLAPLGRPEAGTEFQEAVRRAGGTTRRWAVSSGVTRRLIVCDGGVEVQVQDGRVLSTRIRLDTFDADTLFPGAVRPLARADVHRALGTPAAVSGRAELHRYGPRDLVVRYGPDGEAPEEITTVLGEVGVSHRIHRWRSGEFTLFLDVLGLDADHPLARHVRGLAGTRVRTHAGTVTAVTIGDRGHRPERLAAFADGMPPAPIRTDLPFGVPTHTGDRDDLRDFTQGWIHVHASDGETITTITVSQDPPRSLPVHH